jgi:type I site-specific restriction endonuclease
MSSSGALSEQETCRTFVVPGLKAAGWDRLQIRQQYRITKGKIIASACRGTDHDRAAF